MSRNRWKTSMSICAALFLLTWASWAVAAKPQNESHACEVTVSDRAGDAILSDSLGIYTEAVDASARLWDMKNGVADHLFVEAPGYQSARALKLSIPGVTPVGGLVCALGTLKPNVNSSGYQFYNDLPIGQSTNDVGQNFGGTFKCSVGNIAWNVTYQSQCIVIVHTGAGEWTITADGGCLATVTRTQGRRVLDTWVDQDVPFQVQATEFP